MNSASSRLSQGEPGGISSAGDALSDQTMFDLFRSEMETLGATLNNGLLDLEENPGGMAALETLKKAAHSIKGGAKIAELDAAVRLAHAMEDAFKAVEEGRHVLTPADIDRLLGATDLLIRMAETAGEGELAEPTPEETEAGIAEVAAIGAEGGGQAGPAKAAPSKKRRDKKHPAKTHRAEGTRTESDPGAPPPKPAPRPEPPSAAGPDLRRPRPRRAAPARSDSRTTPPPASLMDAFREEMDGWSDAMMESLDILREDPFDPAALPNLAATLDALLGGARLVELDDVAALAETMSRCFEAADDGTLELEKDQIDRLVDAVDLLLRYTRSSQPDRDPTVSPRVFERIRLDIAAFAEDAAGLDAKPEWDFEFGRDIAPAHGKVAEPDPVAPDEWPARGGERRPEMSAEPDAPEADEAKSQPAAPPVSERDWWTGGDSSADEEAVEDDRGPDETRLPARRETREPAAPPSDAAEGPPPVQASESERTVRVTAAKIERLMGLAGEVVVGSRWLPPFSESLFLLKRGQSELANTLEELQKVLETGDVHRAGKLAFQARERLKGLGRDLGERMGELDMFTSVSANLSDRLYHEVIGVRMSPFAEGVRGYRRRLRDMARELGKRVRLEVAGESTEVDRDILERIGTPLNHLLRNAVDHGIETPAERRAAGKDETGIIRLEAAHRAGMLIVTVSDDGRGVDPDGIRLRLRERGVAGAELAERMSEPELLDYLFQPGFSTAPEVTHLSGRGVGLNVVQGAVHEVG
ncbi:MAG: Hpt domain-containing protein, partial [Thermodesulfobacteriota bacterium]